LRPDPRGVFALRDFPRAARVDLGVRIAASMPGMSARLACATPGVTLASAHAVGACLSLRHIVAAQDTNVLIAGHVMALRMQCICLI
jgi:hypothetical protein